MQQSISAAPIPPPRGATAGHLLTLSVSGGWGICNLIANANANARGLARGAWALLELTDALTRPDICSPLVNGLTGFHCTSNAGFFVYFAASPRFADIQS